MKVLSKSVITIFLFDFLILALSTSLWSMFFGFSMPLSISVVVSTVLAGLCVLFLKENYKIREFNIRFKNSYLLFEGVLFMHIPAIITLFLFSKSHNSLGFLVCNILSVFFFLQLYRVFYHFYLFKFKPEKNILIVGTNNNAKCIINEIKNKKALRMNVSAVLADSQGENVLDKDNYKIYNYNSSIAEIIKENDIEIVIVAIKRRMEESFLTRMIQEIPNNVKLYKMPDFYEMVTGKYFVDEMSINWLFYEYMNKRSVVYDFCKRAYDIIAALIILAVTFPILFIIGYKVKKVDGGPAIYTQNRVGRDGKIFKAYKLRTMYINDYVPQQGKIEHTEGQDKDDRVIPFCRFIRKARLDEIPQMINILKGEMSIVGPRTEWDDLVKIYAKEVSYYPCRQWVRTGWTGWAQINQGHCVLSDDIAEKLQYDLFYLKHRNVLWEIAILVKAVFLALGGRHG